MDASVRIMLIDRNEPRPLSASATQGYRGVFSLNHQLRPGVTALAIGRGTGSDYCAAKASPSQDILRIAWAKLMARAGEEFPL